MEASDELSNRSKAAAPPAAGTDRLLTTVCRKARFQSPWMQTTRKRSIAGSIGFRDRRYENRSNWSRKRGAARSAADGPKWGHNVIFGVRDVNKPELKATAEGIRRG